jgi:hypothetical protein
MKLDGRLLLIAALAACAALLLPTVASADDGGEVRKAGTCTASSRMTIRLRPDDDRIGVELEIRTRRQGSAWNVILLHERRIAFRAVLRSRGDTVRLRRSIADLFGRDSIVVRASGPRLESCRVSAAI